MLMFLSIRKCNVWILAAYVSAINITSFSVRFLREMSCKGFMVLSYWSTGFTSQVLAWQVCDDLRWNTPWRSLHISRWFPVLQPFTPILRNERAPLVVLMQLYPISPWKISARKIMMLLTVRLMGPVFPLLQKSFHPLMCVWYYH